MWDMKEVYGLWERGLESLSGKGWTFRYSRAEGDRTRCMDLRTRVFSGSCVEDWDLEYDEWCDHVMVTRAEDDKLVGCYRLFRGDLLGEGGSYYSSREFCLDGLRGNGLRQVELGRFCVERGFQNGYVMGKLWQSLGLYLRCFRMDMIFGCISFEGKASDHEEEMRWLAKHYGYSGEGGPFGGSWFSGEFFEGGEDVRSRLWRKLPVLVRGYLQMGGRVGLGYYEDDMFGCTDMFVILEVKNIPDRYWVRLDGELMS